MKQKHFFLKLSCFFDGPTDVDNLISDSSAFSKYSMMSESSRFTYCWSLAWRILSITLLACEMRVIVALLTTNPQSHWADDPQTGEQLYQRSSHTVAKVLEPTTNFPTRRFTKGTENSREFDFVGQGDLITELPQDWGNKLLEGTNKTLCTPGPRKKEWPHRRLKQTCLWVSRSL